MKLVFHCVSFDDRMPSALKGKHCFAILPEQHVLWHARLSILYLCTPTFVLGTLGLSTVT